MRLRRDQRKNKLRIVTAYLFFFGGGKIVIAENAYLVALERSDKIDGYFLLTGQHGSHIGGALVDLLKRREPVGGAFGNACADLLHEAADALHEKFIEV